jgi:hypothetical protein
MAFPTSVNCLITDAVTQANLNVLGDAPAVSGGGMAVSTGQAMANAAHNAAFNQAQLWMTAQASTVAGLRQLFGIETGTDPVADGDVNSVGSRRSQVIKETGMTTTYEDQSSYDQPEDVSVDRTAESQYSLGL